MAQAMLEDDLACSLVGVASDPFKVRALHDILGVFCHQCRNTLNSLKLSLYLTKRDASHVASPLWGELDQRYHEVELLFDRLQAICRPMTLTPLRASLSLIMKERGASWVEAMAARDRSLRLVPPKSSDVGEFDPIRLPECLNTFILWRAEVGERGQPAQLGWRIEDDHFLIEWDEPSSFGVGGTPERSDRSDPLALPLLARVLSAHGGTMTLDFHDGLHLRATWPLTVRPSL
ncbi:hypothetical protein [Singulisphaera sp. GP187]|uniref:hypothetical protein n=1 Tax=Singulisphaera sp. GP187 TaxID=1882752 RepID=UPI0020B11687|nr:hypothetical protein [Singulisphaera sp. GP187]